jgi:hypothetical protein
MVGRSMTEKRLGIEIGPRIISWARVRDRPFEARFWRASNDTLEPITGTFVRNRMGAERTDALIRTADQPDVHLVIIRSFDPGELIFAEMTNRVIIGRDRLEEQDVNFGVRFMAEERFIEGLKCRLVKFVDIGNLDEGELWWSDDLQIAVLDNPTGREVSYRLFDIRPYEPRPECFVLHGFRDLDTTGIFDPSCS